MTGPTRRELLRRAGLLTVAGATGSLLAACDSSGRDTSTRDTSTDASVAAPQPGTSGAKARFPDGFVWGAATSAYQVEGAVKEDGRVASIWDTFSHTPGKIRDGSTGDVAVDHYHRYLQDLDLMKELGLQGYRFSIAWPRVLPDGAGQPNQRGIDFYRRLVDGLHRRGVRPLATLFHWDLPQALQDRGGWEAREVAQRFADYAEVMFRALGDAVPTWMTLNEPKTVVDNGYIAGIHAPGKQDRSAAYVAAHHMLLAHGLAVQALRATGSSGRIGPALNLAPVYPAEDTPAARQAAALRDGFENRLYLHPVLRGSYPDDVLAEIDQVSPMRSKIRDGDLKTISAPVDVLGVHYYNPVHVDGAGQRVFKRPTSQASWQELYPDGLYDILVRLKRDGGDIPLMITENGIPSPVGPDAGGRIDDTDRIKFLRDHFLAAHRAIQEGVKLEGYYVWSLLDNFEWAEGHTQRWGMVYVDYRDQRRIPKQSALWYRDVIRANGL
ncbi:MAG TPA: GH1 family beta-glucosidase [Actinomycetes bacterium]|nr:GH1 family beta-glucosidase [Actinomycetes bacterium]